MWNDKISCFDYVKGEGEGKIIFRTKPSVEKEKVIYQVGSADPDLAVEAAKLVVQDVAGIDLNAGCPKHFSIHAGMGAGLLKTPDKLEAILRKLVEEVGRPNGKPISVKIRLLEPHEDTIPLVDRLAKTGISHLTVHCRTTPMRPREPAIRTVLKDIARTCHENGITCFANGDVSTRAHAEELCREYGVDGCMIARAAEANMSVFSSEGPRPWKEVAQQFIRTSIEVHNHVSNAKFVVTKIVPGKQNIYRLLTGAKTNKELCEALEVEWNGYDEVERPKLTKAQKKAANKRKLEEEAEDAGKAAENQSPPKKRALVNNSTYTQADLEEEAEPTRQQMAMGAAA